MRARNLFLIMTMVLFVLLLGLAYFKYNRPAAPTVAAVAVKTAVVPTADLGAGALIKPQDLSFAPFPTGLDERDYFMRPNAPGQQDNADHDTTRQIVGAVVRHRIAAGTPISKDSVVKPGDSGFLAAVLAPGMQAITIGVTAVSGTGGLIYPGDRVDVILTQNFSQTSSMAGTHRFGAEPVVQNVRVLAIDQQLQTNASPNTGKLAQTVTVEVTPTQAEAVVLATKLGDLSLSIRSLVPPADPGLTTTGPIWAEDVSPALKSVERAQYEESASTKPTPVMVLRGSQGATPAMPAQDGSGTPPTMPADLALPTPARGR